MCTISVIHSQIKDKEKVIRVLSEELELEPEIVRKRVEKVSSMAVSYTHLPRNDIWKVISVMHSVYMQ